MDFKTCLIEFCKEVEKIFYNKCESRKLRGRHDAALGANARIVKKISFFRRNFGPFNIEDFEAKFPKFSLEIYFKPTVQIFIGIPKPFARVQSQTRRFFFTTKIVVQKFIEILTIATTTIKSRLYTFIKLFKF